MNEIVEKPGPDRIKSDYALIGGSVYEPEMFNAIEEAMHRLARANAKESRELVYVDAINILLERQKTCHSAKITNGNFYDCGNKLEYLKAVVKFGLRHEDLREEFGDYLKNLNID